MEKAIVKGEEDSVLLYSRSRDYYKTTLIRLSNGGPAEAL